MTPQPRSALPERFPGRPSSTVLAGQLLELARQISDRRSFRPDAALGRALRLAVSLAPGVRWATCIASGPRAVPFTSASTGTVAAELDGHQYGHGQGPGLEALATGGIVLTSDLTTEHRWPDFCAAAVRATPARTVFSYPLALAGQPGTTLNLYGDDPMAAISHQAELLAAAAGASLVMAAIGARGLAENLHQAVQSNRTIGAAIGIVMHELGCTQEQAFTAIRRRSQREHGKLRDVAEEIVASGGLTLPPGD